MNALFKQFWSEKRISLAVCMLAVLLFGLCPVGAQYSKTACASCKIWNLPQEPFRIFGNTYYVGTHGLSSILITSPSGHVLIDGALPDSVEQIRAHILALGFRVQDVKLILNSHVHFDHAGGIAQLQNWSHAKVDASEWSAKVLAHGGVGRDDPQYGLLPDIRKVKHVGRVQDGGVVRVGDIVMTAHLTAGHTPGGTSWTWQSCEAKRCLNLVYADSLTPVSAPGFKFTEHSDALTGFGKSFSFLETTACDILITTHPEISDVWGRLERRTKGETPDPMVDPNACKALATHARALLQQRVGQEQRR